MPQAAIASIYTLWRPPNGWSQSESREWLVCGTYKQDITLSVSVRKRQRQLQSSIDLHTRFILYLRATGQGCPSLNSPPSLPLYHYHSNEVKFSRRITHKTPHITFSSNHEIQLPLGCSPFIPFSFPPSLQL